MQKLKMFMEDINRRLSQLEMLANQQGSLTEIATRLQALEQRVYTQKDKFTVPEACEYLGIAESTMYKMTCTRQIPHFKRGKFIYFERAELDKWVSQNRVASVDETIDAYYKEHPQSDFNAIIHLKNGKNI